MANILEVLCISMKPIFFAPSSAQEVDVVQREGLNYIRLSPATSNDNLDCPVIEKEDLPFLRDDIYVLDSTKSGSTIRPQEKGFYERMLRPLLSNLFSINHMYYATQSITSIKEFAASLKNNGRPILIIIISGDTSINEFVNNIAPTLNGICRIFVIPAGTGNSLALSLGLTDEVNAVQRLFSYRQSDIHDLNLYEASFPEGSYIAHADGSQELLKVPILFLVVASWAFHASLVADSESEELRKLGLERFKVAAKANLSRPQIYTGRVDVIGVDEEPIQREGPFAYFVLTPSQRFEPTFVISPSGDILDSNLYMIGFSTEDSEDYILDIMGKVYNCGNHVTDERVFYDKIAPTQKIQLKYAENELFENRRFCIDGAIVIVPEYSSTSSISFKFRGNEHHGWNFSIIA